MAAHQRVAGTAPDVDNLVAEDLVDEIYRWRLPPAEELNPIATARRPRSAGGTVIHLDGGLEIS